MQILYYTFLLPETIVKISQNAVLSIAILTEIYKNARVPAYAGSIKLENSIKYALCSCADCQKENELSLLGRQFQTPWETPLGIQMDLFCFRWADSPELVGIGWFLYGIRSNIVTKL